MWNFIKDVLKGMVIGIANVIPGVSGGTMAVAMGIYAAVLHALTGMDKDLLLVAKDDEMGRQLQDLDLITRKRAPRRNRE